MKTHFAAQLMAFKNTDDGDPVVEEVVAAEVTTCDKEGVEIAFNDRDERIYLKFRQEDFVRAMGEVHDA